MAWSDVVPALESLAPTIATAVGTPLLGGAVAALEAVFGLTPAQGTSMTQRQNDVAMAVANATPEQLAAVRAADQQYALQMAQAGFKDKETIAQLGVTEEQAFIADTEDARRANAANQRVFWLGVVILGTFAAIIGMSLWGAYLILVGKLPVENAAVVGMVAGFVGTIVGYAAANAQQVTGFYYGSSKGSESKSDAMAAAFQKVFSSAPTGKK